MNVFEKITESPETLASLLRAIPAIETPWDDAFHRAFCDNCAAKDIISYRCFAPGRCKGRVVGVKRFDPYIPAWCPKLERSRENG